MKAGNLQNRSLITRDRFEIKILGGPEGLALVLHRTPRRPGFSGIVLLFKNCPGKNFQLPCFKERLGFFEKYDP
jgi:hypothetical protein